MRKNTYLKMAAAMLGLGSAAQTANKSAIEFKKSASMGDAPRTLFPPDYGVTPKQYGTYIATRQSNMVKRKRRSKVAFG
jgi:hypothetical protein